MTVTSVIREKIDGRTYNHLFCDDGTEFYRTFCPRVAGDKTTIVDLFAEGAMPKCDLDCDRYYDCRRDPRFNEWGWCVYVRTAREYRVNLKDRSS